MVEAKETLVTLEELNARTVGYLPGLLGVEFTNFDRGLIESRMVVRKDLLAPNGYLHAASVIGLADSSCGFGTLTNLPAGATGFTTIEVKSNFLGTALEGTITCEARLVHGGKTTQVWDAQVFNANTAQLMCLFRCTQLILYPKS
jgi:1,4-dihydroxy-2-naphthoyl-CoA hydrolase